jgi:hypothetical protein
MFNVADVLMVLRKINLKKEDAEIDDGEAGADDEAPQIVRLCETTFRIGLLTHDLAHATDLPIVRHCFGRDKVPSWDVTDVRFTPPEATFMVSLKTAVDLPDAIASFANASIKSIKVWRPKEDARDLSMEFVTRHELLRNDVRALADLLTAWETGALYVTLTEIRPPLFEDIDAPAARGRGDRQAH